MKNKTPFWDNIKYIVSNWFLWDKSRSYAMLLLIPVRIIVPTITALIPKIMIDFMQSDKPISALVFMLGGLSLLVAAMAWFEPAIYEIGKAMQINVGMRYSVMSLEKLLTLDYSILESYEGRTKFERSKSFAFGGATSTGAELLWDFLGCCTSLLGFGTYIIILSRLNIFLILIIVIASILDYLCYQSLRYMQHKLRDKKTPLDMKIEYFFRLATDPSAGKDIRLTGATTWLFSIINSIIEKYAELLKWDISNKAKAYSLQGLCSLVRDCATYVFLIVSVLNGKLGVSDFIFYLGLVLGFSSWISGISRYFVKIQFACEECQRFRDFMNISNMSEKNVESHSELNSAEDIEFKNVYFSYDNIENVLVDVNFFAKKGDKIAIVGENGAGKTTLIKLLCGLYAPNAGQIMVNGKNSSSIDQEDYFNYFSVVFQDHLFLPASIASNICFEDDANIQIILRVLEKVGLSKKIESLPNGLDSLLIKQINDEAVDFSGGEKQRLLFSRALYKNAPVFILDEPTAAMDAIAEKNLYEDYDALLKDKIAFFISHRLASARFCDMILFMKDGRIVERGTHDELMSSCGAYWKMFQTQSYYYQKEGVLE